MQTYLVGGAVRDALMGLPVHDRDWVVVGSTPEAMGAAGFVPVGRDFPVFLHPQTHEEYALARTERKTAPGYRGFVVHAAPEVSLVQDLARRDLTINAMAAPPAADGRLPDLHAIEDPFGGRSDLQARVLRHTSDAFSEDPVRILRVARFAARFPDFSVAEATLSLMRAMVDGGEVQHLVPERIWQELAKGLMTQRPARMLEVLRSCGALRAVLPEVDGLWGVPQSPEHHPEVDTGVHLGLVLDAAAAAGAPLAVRFACLGHDLGKAGTDPAHWPRHIGHEGRSVRALKVLCARLRVPQACAELAEVVAREHGNVHRSADLGPEAVLRLLERCDAFRKPARFADVLLACQCDARGRLGRSHDGYPQAPRLSAALQAAQSVDSAGVAEAAMAAGAKGPEVGRVLARARVQAISQALC